MEKKAHSEQYLDAGYCVSRRRVLGSESTFAASAPPGFQKRRS
jgi:hypothetical protein